MQFISCTLFQFVDRITILIMPQKYQPDLIYLRHVPLKRVHIFTAIQIFCMAIMWFFKSTKQIALLFPLMVGKYILYKLPIIIKIKLPCNYIQPLLIYFFGEPDSCDILLVYHVVLQVNQTN